MSIAALIFAAGVPGSADNLQARSVCMRAMRDLPAGSRLKDGQFEPTACVAGYRSVFRYDPVSRDVHTAIAVRAGEIVRQWSGLDQGAVTRGDKVVVKAVVGRVTVEKEAQALQSAAAGERLFVRDSDGQIFSVKLLK